MKNKFLTVINSAALVVINSIFGGFDQLVLTPGEKRKRYRLSPYGVFPATLSDGRTIQQVIDRQAAEEMIANNSKLTSKLDSLFRGIPIYEGHADDAAWVEKNPGHKTLAVGRIKSIEAGDDGIYVDAVFNEAGAAMLSGEAPMYCGHSPRWRMQEVPGKPGHYRPVLLWSDALTNYPNIAGNTIALNSLGLDDEPSLTDAEEPADEPENATDMKLTPELLKRLGFAPDATPTETELMAALVKVLDENEAAKAKTAEKKEPEVEKPAAQPVTASNTAEITELKAVKTAAITDKVNAAITAGRITEADKTKWVDALNTDFAGESAKLEKLMPTINTTSQLPSQGKATAADVANTAATITDTVTAFAKDKGIDVSNQAGWDRAFNECRAAKPEVFARA